MKKNENLDNANDKINLDYDWNTEYGDGDIPDIDKNSADNSASAHSTSSKRRAQNL